jgi:hypothetical protein
MSAKYAQVIVNDWILIFILQARSNLPSFYSSYGGRSSNEGVAAVGSYGTAFGCRDFF